MLMIVCTVVTGASGKSAMMPASDGLQNACVIWTKINNTTATLTGKPYFFFPAVVEAMPYPFQSCGRPRRRGGAYRHASLPRHAAALAQGLPGRPRGAPLL